MVFEVPTLTGLDPSQPDYLAKLEEGCHRLDELAREALRAPLPTVDELATSLREAGIAVEPLQQVNREIRIGGRLVEMK